MIITLLIWAFIFISSFVFGKITLGLFQRLQHNGNSQNWSPAITSATGLITLTMLLSYASFLLPMNQPLLQAGVLLITIAGSWQYRKSLAGLCTQLRQVWVEASVLHKAFLVIFSLFILIKASGQVQSVDSGAYHLPFIKWMEQYPVIKGLANVHSRFGFNYHYHILYAFVGFANIFGTTIHALNGYLFLLGFIYFYGLYTRPGQSSLIRTSCAIALVYISQINKGMTGFSPDLPVAVFQMIIIFECLSYACKRAVQTIPETESRSFTTVLLWLTLGTITLKLASVAVLFVLLFCCFRELFRLRTIAAGLLIAIVLLAPYFGRNYLISGYLVYPFYSVDIFNVAWKVPLFCTIQEKIVIKNWALGYDNYYQGGYSYNIALFKQWLHRMQELNKAYLPVIYTMIACIVLLAGLWLKLLFTRKAAELSKGAYLVLYGLLTGLFFWWFNAPDLRFGNGIILPFIAVTLGITYTSLFPANKPDKWIHPAFAAIISLAALLSLRGLAISSPILQSNEVKFSFLLQPPYPRPDTSTRMIQGQKTYLSSSEIYGKCWECPLPCAYEADQFLYIEPGVIRKGFISAYPRQATPPAAVQQ